MQSTSELTAQQAIKRILTKSGVRFDLKRMASPKAEADFELYFPINNERLLVEYKAGLAPFQLSGVLAHLRRQVGPRRRVGLCVRRATWTLLEACKEADVALFDLEGNAYIKMPGLYIERIRPNRGIGTEPTSGTVFTAKATRLVRAFLKRYPYDWVQADLVRKTGLSAGYVSTLVKRLANERYILDRMGLLYLDDPERMLDDWVAHYRFDRHHRLSYAISTASYEDGIKKLGEQLNTSVKRFAWTGWTGAHLRAPHATPSTYMAYVSNTPKKMNGVFPVEKEGNVVLYVPHDEGAFQFSTPSKNGEIVSDAQLYLDLCRMPGRAKEQAEALRHHCLEFSRMTV